MVDTDILHKLSTLLEEKSKKGVSWQLLIDCPDCGRGIAFRGKCPTCNSKYWLPAGYKDPQKGGSNNNCLTTATDLAIIGLS